MKDVFQKNSGIPYAEEVKQQLKQTIHGGSIPEMKAWVDGQLVDFGICPLNHNMPWVNRCLVPGMSHAC